MIGKSSVPPSVADATSFGVLISMMSFSSKYWRTVFSMFAFILKIADTFAFLKSRNLEFSLVSISAFTFSVGSIGRGWLARFKILTSVGMISTPLGAFPASWAVPLIATTDSFLKDLKSSRIFASTFLLGAVT